MLPSVLDATYNLLNVKRFADILTSSGSTFQSSTFCTKNVYIFFITVNPESCTYPYPKVSNRLPLVFHAIFSSSRKTLFIVGGGRVQKAQLCQKLSVKSSATIWTVQAGRWPLVLDVCPLLLTNHFTDWAYLSILMLRS